MRWTTARKAIGVAALGGVVAVAGLMARPDGTEVVADDPGAADPEAVLSAAGDAYQFLQADDSLTVTPDGVIVADPPPVGPLPADAFLATAALTADEAPTQAQAFSLSSRPAAERVIYLDFDGHTMSGTAWNGGRADPIVLQPYDSDGNPGFSPAELQAIVDVWERVAEDFAPFDVNVTTIDPGVERLRRTGSGDDQYGIRVLITPTSEWYGVAGGVAYIGSFAWSNDTPAFVFSNHLGNGYWRYVAEASSHEVGHTAGLYHDGTAGSAYYSGHGDWGPIMGASYLRNVTHWSNGDYANANNTEDDLAKLGAAFGLIDGGPTAPVSVGDTPVTGVITASGQTRSFVTTVGAGTMNVRVQTVGDNNLVANVVVRDQANNVVATLTPTSPSAWDVSANVPVSAGTYRIDVTSIGWGSGPSGFSNYGSIGTFTVSVDASGGVSEPPPQEPEPEVLDDGDDLEGVSLTPIDPERLVDTRAGRAGISRLAAGQTMRINVRAAAGVPGDATAAALNVTAVAPSDVGYLSINPCNGDTSTSAVNYRPGTPTPNSIIATLSNDGAVCIYSVRAVDLVVDVTAWLGPTGSSKLNLVGPVRAADSRQGLGFSRRLTAGQTTALPLSSVLSPGATGAALNLTIVGATNAGNAVVFPCSAVTSSTSTVNFPPQAARANNVIVKVDADRRVCVRTTANAHVIVDVTGEFNSTGLTYVPAAPDRLQDTRRAGGALRSGGQTTFTAPGVSGTSRVPAVVSANITAVSLTPGFVTAWGCDARPGTSTLNAAALQAIANGALVPLSGNGTGCLFATADANLIVDLHGWWID